MGYQPDPFVVSASSSIRVPTLQVQVFAENKLANHDPISGCMPLKIPTNIKNIALLFNAGTALTTTFDTSGFAGITSTIESILSALPAIATALGGLITACLVSLTPITLIPNPMEAMNEINQLLSLLASNPFGIIFSQVLNLINSIVTLAGIISVAGSVAAQLGMAAIGTIDTILEPLLNGSLIASILAAGVILTSISTLVGSGLVALAGGLAALNASLLAAIAAITLVINGINVSIQAAMNILHHTSHGITIGQLHGASCSSDFTAFILAVASAELLALL